MKKTNKDLPDFSKGEEIFSAVTHIVGGGLGVVALVLGIVFASIYNDAYCVVSVIIYGLSLVILYTMSSIYHFLRKNKAKKVFRILDHCTIFLLIAGSYTPFCLVTLRNSGAWGWTLFGIIWGFAVLGVVGNAINMHNIVIKILSQICYIVMGWCVLLALGPLMENIELGGFILLLLGGIAYTIGAIFFAFGSKYKWIHSIWHLFVLLGSILHFFAIFFYVVL